MKYTLKQNIVYNYDGKRDSKYIFSRALDYAQVHVSTAISLELYLYSHLLFYLFTYFCAYIHLRFKHAVLGTQLSCLSSTVRK